MKDQESAAHATYGSLLLQAAGVLRLRYVQCKRDAGLSPATAEELASVLEGIAKGHPAYDQIDPKEAIALAHRVIDDDHPELSHIWPRTG
ncbi:hypothetical protein HFP15_33150 [Amycolatopsis sp. K13G38]|uniref:Uncharacterized protein n=1 Tax=Amycolatopsis acididurans TaxID=2724524 RepID=A0ABX1JD56_9PSEU|nr:hypothetical protein [Amycolatopsis acididurans]NKQ57720.1 hypothetical protein [Amycolatopsis acididurans]